MSLKKILLVVALSTAALGGTIATAIKLQDSIRTRKDFYGITVSHTTLNLENITYKIFQGNNERNFECSLNISSIIFPENYIKIVDLYCDSAIDATVRHSRRPLPLHDPEMDTIQKVTSKYEGTIEKYGIDESVDRLESKVIIKPK